MFIFGNKTSTEMGLNCVLYTLRNKPKFAYNTYTIPGKAEPFIEIEDNAEPVTVEVECDLMDIANIDDIYAWLHGKGLLIDQLHPDKYRIAYSVDSISPVMLNDEICTLIIKFLCSSFMYAVDNQPETIEHDQLGSGTITNNGTYYSEPQIILTPDTSVSGTSSPYVSLGINSSFITLEMIPEDFRHNIVFDAERQLVFYEDTGDIILERTRGTVPFLDVGKNTYQFMNGSDGNNDQTVISTAKIYKNERWL